MKKCVFLLAAVMLLVICIPMTTMASETVDASPELSEILPIAVIRDPDNMEIRKVYELATSIDPGSIPRESFEQSGALYECSDILREVVIGEETRTLTETETVESAKNDMDTILGLLPESKEVVTEDGFFGVLMLRPSTIKSEVSGYGSSTKTVDIYRSYPNLSDADTQYLPKSVDEGGITYTLSDVQWQTDNTMNIDDYEIKDRYTANVTYSGSKSSSYVKGYITTADYVGEVCRTGVSSIRYTVIFIGTIIPEPEPETTMEPMPDPVAEATPAAHDYTWAFIVIPVLLVLAALLLMGYRRNKNRKELLSHAQTYEHDYPDAYADGSAHTDGDSGVGGGER